MSTNYAFIQGRGGAMKGHHKNIPMIHIGSNHGRTTVSAVANQSGLFQILAAISFNYTMQSHINGSHPQGPSGITRPPLKRRRSRYASLVRSDAELNTRLCSALPVDWDGLIVDQYPDEQTEAIYLIKASNIRQERALTENEISRFEPGDLVLANVHEPTTDPNGRVGDDDVTATIFGQAVSKARFHILLEKHPKHGVFAPIGSRGLKGLQGLSEMERHCRVGFRKAEENFDRDKLTAGDPEFLSLHDPVELRQGVLDRWSFLDLSYRTSLYWSSNIQFKGYLTRSDTRRVLELSASNDKDDPDRPKGTAEEQKRAFTKRNMENASVVQDLVKTEKKLFKDVDDATLSAAQAEIHARKTVLEYQDMVSTGTAGEHALELFKNAAEQAVLDRDTAREKRDRLTASVEEVLAHPELRPRVPAGTDINEQRLTIINNATKSLQDRLQSIAKQK
ncbi:hypothetical protein B0T12DRAFT_478513 [Alternaria alternata]|nr:hypothetical protein B0T12DRAFT_478513 [Alternaria alternata]